MMADQLVGHVSDESELTDAYLRMIFNSVRSEVKKSINNANWINENLSGYLLTRLSETQLQIGFSDRVTTTEEFINGYYDNFLIRLRANNLMSRWEFVKHKMEHRIQNGTNRDEVLISALYPIEMHGDFDREPFSSLWNGAARYSTELNTIIVSRNKVKSPYFSRKYPLAVNFARFGRDITDTLLNIVEEMNQEYLIKSEIVRSKGKVVQSGVLKDIRYIPYGNTVTGESKRCILGKLNMRDPKLPQRTQDSLYNQVRVARMTSRALGSLLRMIDNGKHVTGMGKVSFAELGLKERLRQPGLRQLDELQLFSVAYMQNFCAETDQNYAKLKPFIELEVSRRSM